MSIITIVSFIVRLGPGKAAVVRRHLRYVSTSVVAGQPEWSHFFLFSSSPVSLPSWPCRNNSRTRNSPLLSEEHFFWLRNWRVYLNSSGKCCHWHGEQERNAIFRLRAGSSPWLVTREILSTFITGIFLSSSVIRTPHLYLSKKKILTWLNHTYLPSPGTGWHVLLFFQEFFLSSS